MALECIPSTFSFPFKSFKQSRTIPTTLKLLLSGHSVPGLQCKRRQFTQVQVSELLTGKGYKFTRVLGKRKVKFHLQFYSKFTNKKQDLKPVYGLKVSKEWRTSQSPKNEDGFTSFGCRTMKLQTQFRFDLPGTNRLVNSVTDVGVMTTKSKFVARYVRSPLIVVFISNPFPPSNMFLYILLTPS